MKRFLNTICFVGLFSIAFLPSSASAVVFGLCVLDDDATWWLTRANLVLVDHPVVLGVTEVKSVVDTTGSASSGGSPINTLNTSNENPSDIDLSIVNGNTVMNMAEGSPLLATVHVTKNLATTPPTPLTWDLDWVATFWSKSGSQPWVEQTDLDDTCDLIVSTE